MFSDKPGYLTSAQQLEVSERSRDAIARHTGGGILTQIEAVEIALVEMIAEHRDTIEVVADFLASAAENEGVAGLGHIFAPDAIDFAHKQIAFENAQIAILEGNF